MSALGIEATGIVVRLGDDEVLRGVDIAVESGMVVGLLGPSGAGKSTLFRVLAGELAPNAGCVLLAGEDVTGLPLWRRARRGLGWVPQGPSVLHDLSVADNVRTFERAARAPERSLEERAAEVGLEGRLPIRASSLSGGERRRLEILRALVAEPRVLLCDEPLAGVDPVGAQKIGEILRRRAEGGTAVLVADHRVTEALAFCDEACLLVDGRVGVRAPTGHFASHPQVRRRYLG